MSIIVDTTEMESFTIVWKIENFSFIPRLEKCDGIQSRVFIVEYANNQTQWCLQIESPGYYYCETDPFILRLIRMDVEGVKFFVSYELSILSKNNPKIKSLTINDCWFHPDNRIGKPLFITTREIFGNGENLPDDILFIQCKMWWPQCLEPAFCLARTRIGVERKSFPWPIEQFSDLKVNDARSVIVHFQPNMQLSLTLTLYVTGIPSHTEKIGIDVIGNSEESSDVMIMLGISVQNINGKAIYKFEDEFKLSQGIKEWRFPLLLHKKRLDSKKHLLLPDDVLSLRCVLVVFKLKTCHSIALNEIEPTSYGAKAALDLEAALGSTSLSVGNESHSCPNSLTNDVKRLFEDKYLTDINICVRDEVFPAHKVILASRSSVLKRMFDTDTKENLTSTIQIEDFEPSTIRRLLEYIYSDIWDSSVHWGDAYSLYLAAEKYAVVGLKKKCSSFLKRNLNLINVCEILYLAGIVNDEDLKDSILDFIQENDEVLDSYVWKLLERENAQLALEILTRLYKNAREF